MQCHCVIIHMCTCCGYEVHVGSYYTEGWSAIRLFLWDNDAWQHDCYDRSRDSETWLILPVVICSSQRLSHACLSSFVNCHELRWAHYICRNCFGNFSKRLTLRTLELIRAANPTQWGGDGYYQKPVRVNDLVTLVEKHMSMDSRKSNSPMQLPTYQFQTV